MKRKIIAHLLLWLYDIAHTLDSAITVLLFSLGDFNLFGDLVVKLAQWVARRELRKYANSTRSASETQPRWNIR